MSANRSNLKSWNSDFVKEYRPKGMRNASTANQLRFDDAVASAVVQHEVFQNQAHKEYLKQMQEVLGDADTDTSDDESTEDRPRLKAGDMIFYWQPGGIMGSPDAMIETKVLAVYDQERIAQTDCPLRLANGHVLSMHNEVKVFCLCDI